MDPDDVLVGEDALELIGEDVDEEDADDGVEVLGGASSLQRKKLAEFVSDSASCRFCCSKNFFRSLWKERMREVRAVFALEAGSNESRVGAGFEWRFWNVCTKPFVVMPVQPEIFSDSSEGDLRTR